MDPSQRRISIGLKESYFPVELGIMKSEKDGMETAKDQEADVKSDADGKESNGVKEPERDGMETSDQEADVKSDDDVEESQEDDDMDGEKSVELQGAQSDDGN